jgi:hypothetical protein
MTQPDTSPVLEARDELGKACRRRGNTTQGTTEILATADIYASRAAAKSREDGIHEGVRLERQRTIDASTMPGYIRQQETRVAALELLAASMLATFGATDQGYRARVGQAQIAKWQATLTGDKPYQAHPGARYWVLVADELLEGEHTVDWSQLGLHLVESGPAESPGMRWIRFQDDNAPPEMTGSPRVELTIGETDDGKPVITERRIIG